MPRWRFFIIGPLGTYKNVPDRSSDSACHQRVRDKLSVSCTGTQTQKTVFLSDAASSIVTGGIVASGEYALEYLK